MVGDDLDTHLSSLLNIPCDEVESEIEIALRQLIAFLGFDRSSFAEFDAEGRLDVLCSVAVKGSSPVRSVQRRRS